MVKMTVRKESERELVLEFEDEDHTLGNLITKMALRDPRVSYATYRIEHPLKPKMTVEIRTNGSAPPREVLIEVLKKIIELTETFEKQLKDELSKKRG